MGWKHNPATLLLGIIGEGRGDEKVISIIVPIYNSDKYLRQCLNSLRYQSYHRVEIILVDDGSTDNSKSICEKYCKMDQRFRLINTNKIGSSAALNVGLLASRGDYIGFVHPGDWVEEDMFEQLMTNLIKYDAEIVVCRYIEEVKDELHVPSGPEETRFLTPSEAIHLMLLQSRTESFLCNKLFSIKLFKNEPSILFDQSIHLYEDLDVCSRLYLKSQSILFVPDPKYHYMTANHAWKMELFPRYSSGLIALLNLLNRLKDYTGQNVMWLLKEMYFQLNLQLIMMQHLLKPRPKRLLKDLKRNLYRFKLTEIKDSALQWLVFLTRVNVSVGYYFWQKSTLNYIK